MRFTAEFRVSLMVRKVKVKVWDPLIRTLALAKKLKTPACIALLWCGLSDNLPRVNHLSLDLNVSEHSYFEAEFSLKIGSNSGSGEAHAPLTRRGDMTEAGTHERCAVD